MDAVATAARVSKSTLYGLYPNRHALLCAVVDAEAERIDWPLSEAPETLDQLRLQLEQLVVSMHAFLADGRHAAMMQAMGQAAPPLRDLRAVYLHGPQRSLCRIADHLAQANDLGLVAVPDPNVSAEWLLGMAMGLDLVRAMYRQPSPRESRSANTAYARAVADAFLAMHRPNAR